MIFTLILSFLTSCIPSLLGLWKNKQDNTLQLAIMQLQIQANKYILEEKMQEIGIQTDLEGLKTRYQTFTSQNKIIAAINDLVRPVIAYGFLGTYIFIKIAFFYIHGLVHWVEFDYHIMGAVIGFYYGGKTNERLLA